MTYLQVNIPTRGRPHTVKQIVEAFDATRTDNAEARLTFIVDHDDPLFGDYRQELYEAAQLWPMVMATMFEAEPWDVVHGVGMVGALNQASMVQLNRSWLPYAIMFMGDDHRPRTAAFVNRYLDALADLPIVYGNDLFQGENLPTQFAMRADVVKALGFVFPPVLFHLYADNYILELGREIGVNYLPDVVVEHMHPAAGKAPMDDNYARVNAQDVDAHDKAEFGSYMSDGRFAADIERVKAAVK